MRAVLLAVACLALMAAAAPAASAEDPGPGGSCHVVEEYVTEAHTSGSVTGGDFSVEPGARRPIECYY